eukprot:EG_transcript_40569
MQRVVGVDGSLLCEQRKINPFRASGRGQWWNEEIAAILWLTNKMSLRWILDAMGCTRGTDGSQGLDPCLPQGPLGVTSGRKARKSEHPPGWGFLHCHCTQRIRPRCCCGGCNEELPEFVCPRSPVP